MRSPEGWPNSLAACDPSLDVFFDRYDLRAGAFWIPALSDAVGEADAVIVLLGACSPGPWQRLEYFEALDRKAKEPRFPIIPVLLPSATPRLPFLYQLHQIRLAELDHYRCSRPTPRSTAGRACAAT